MDFKNYQISRQITLYPNTNNDIQLIGFKMIMFTKQWFYIINYIEIAITKREKSKISLSIVQEKADYTVYYLL